MRRLAVRFSQACPELRPGLLDWSCQRHLHDIRQEMDGRVAASMTYVEHECYWSISRHIMYRDLRLCLVL